MRSQDRLISGLEERAAGLISPAPGDPMPPFVLTDDEGHLVSLEEIRAPPVIATIFKMASTILCAFYFFSRFT